MAITSGVECGNGGWCRKSCKEKRGWNYGDANGPGAPFSGRSVLIYARSGTLLLVTCHVDEVIGFLRVLDVV